MDDASYLASGPLLARAVGLNVGRGTCCYLAMHMCVCVVSFWGGYVCGCLDSGVVGIAGIDGDAGILLQWNGCVVGLCGYVALGIWVYHVPVLYVCGAISRGLVIEHFVSPYPYT